MVCFTFYNIINIFFDLKLYHLIHFIKIQASFRNKMPLIDWFPSSSMILTFAYPLGNLGVLS